MKILHVMLGQGLGGIEQVFLDYTKMLRTEGVEVIPVIHPKAAIRPHVPDAMLLPNWGKWDPLAMLRLRKLIAYHKPDIALTHTNRALSLVKPSGKQVRIVSVAHNYWLKHFKGLRNAIATTEDIAQKLRAMQVPNVFVIPNVAPVPSVFPKRSSYRRPPVIGAMGRFVHKKGFDSFLHALAELNTRNIDFRVLLGGQGEEEAALKELTRKLSLEDKVQFIGWVKNKQEFFEEIDIFCLPSRSEPFGIVLLEAFAHGVPVVSSRNEGASVIAHDGVDALLYEEGKLADNLLQLLKDENKAYQLAIHGLETVKAYQPSLIGKRLKKALEQVL